MCECQKRERIDRQTERQTIVCYCSNRFALLEKEAHARVTTSMRIERRILVHHLLSLSCVHRSYDSATTSFFDNDDAALTVATQLLLLPPFLSRKSCSQQTAPCSVRIQLCYCYYLRHYCC